MGSFAGEWDINRDASPDPWKRARFRECGDAGVNPGCARPPIHA
jgi:hypothetical protein